MDMIGLNSQLDNLPLVFPYHLFNDLLQTVMDWPYHYLAASLRTSDDMIDNEMDRMLLMIVPMFYAGSIV
jgi:hypothetical protein